MKARICSDHWVEIVPESILLGSSWAPDTEGIPFAWQLDSVSCFFQRLMTYPRPLYLDIGAGLGSYTLLTVLHTGARCVAVEPNPGASRG